jgi:Fic family protein
MQDPKFHHRFNFSPVVNARIIKLLTEIESQKTSFVVQSNLSPQLINRLIKSVIITSAAASTRIEGGLLEDKQVKDLFSKLKIQKFKSRDEQEVAGYLELLKVVFESWKTTTFSESMIKNFHNLLLKYSDKDDRHRGVYKFGSNRVEARDADGKLIGVLFDPTPPHLVQKEMQELVEYTQSELEKADFHPLLIIANFVFEYLTIHPFQDGNGRSSRVLTNFLMLKAGYTFTPFISHERIIEKNKEEYYQVLNTGQRTWKTEKEDISAWVLFFLNMVKIQGIEAVKLLENKEDMELILTENQLMVWQMLEQSDSPLSRSQIQKQIQIPLPTVRQALQKLIDLEKIQMLGQGAGTKYRVIENLK